MKPTTPDSISLLARLINGEAHLWLTKPGDIKKPGQLAAYAALLSPEETARHKRFRFEQDQHHYLVSHALVRKALSFYGEVDPASWQFSENAHGKPEITVPSIPTPLRFNLSHTEGLVACVITSGADCGVDAETVTAPHNAMGVAKKMFASTEVSVLETLDGEAFLAQFIRYWTLREAYCKALGVGIAHDKKDYAFDLTDMVEAHIRFDEASGNHSDDWQFSLLKPTPDHIVAVAIQTGESQQKRIVSEFIIP